MISPESVDTDNKKQSLSSEHWEEFVDQYEEEYKALSEDSVRSAVESEVRRNEPRYKVFSAVKDAFSPTNDLTNGYGVATTSPLCDIEGTGADLLLASTDINYIDICVVFCKPSASSYSGWGRNINRMKRAIENHKGVIKSRLGNESKTLNAVQYATAVPAEEVGDIDTTSVTRAISAEVDNYSIWSIDDDYIPSDSTTPTGRLEVSEGRIEDRELESVLSSGVDYRSAMNISIKVSPSTPTKRILKETIQNIIQENKAHGEEEPKEFNESEFVDKFIDLCEVNEPCREKERFLSDRAKDAIDEAGTLGVITSANSRINSGKDYRALCQGDGTSNIKESISEKIIKSKMPKKRAEIAYDIADRNFTNTDNNRSELGDFT
jgi:hypothetical protein